ncbi:MAG: hypothetical protein R3A10_01765 [Caldilineaceae bacterium]
MHESARPGSPSCCWSRTGRAGTSCSSSAGWQRWRAERLGGMPTVRTRCKRPLQPVTPAHTAAATDWPRIAALYDALAQMTPSPVVELNRAVALAMAYGPEVGLELVDLLVQEPSLAEYPLLPSVRGDLLEKLGNVEEARRVLARLR